MTKHTLCICGVNLPVTLDLLEDLKGICGLNPEEELRDILIAEVLAKKPELDKGEVATQTDVAMQLLWVEYEKWRESKSG